MNKLIPTLVAVAVLSGCSEKIIVKETPAPERIPPVSEANSRQVGSMPYVTNGIIVANGSNWFMGDSAGIQAYATRGGIKYLQVDDATGRAVGYNKKGQQKAVAEDLKNDKDVGGIASDAVTGAASEAAGEASKGAAGGSLANLGHDGEFCKKHHKEMNGEHSTRHGESCINLDEQVDGFELIDTYTTHFDIDSTKVSVIDINGVTQMAAKNANLGEGLMVMVVGFTDATGSDAYNKRLADKRANAVKGVVLPTLPKAQYKLIGAGKCPQVATNDTANGQAKNRRVEVRIYREVVKK